VRALREAFRATAVLLARWFRLGCEGERRLSFLPGVRLAILGLGCPQMYGSSLVPKNGAVLYEMNSVVLITDKDHSSWVTNRDPPASIS
jgi:hypothetical protein